MSNLVYPDLSIASLLGQFVLSTPNYETHQHNSEETYCGSCFLTWISNSTMILHCMHIQKKLENSCNFNCNFFFNLCFWCDVKSTKSINFFKTKKSAPDFWLPVTYCCITGGEYEYSHNCPQIQTAATCIVQSLSIFVHTCKSWLELSSFSLLQHILLQNKVSAGLVLSNWGPLQMFLPHTIAASLQSKKLIHPGSSVQITVCSATSYSFTSPISSNNQRLITTRCMPHKHSKHQIKLIPSNIPDRRQPKTEMWSDKEATLDWNVLWLHP